ncbi:chitin synthesis regulation, resistance to congo red-domain-containing protein [Nemania sp. NC0429]|nr:chitin synthesis regulation, resistance to congo red-domain-containing protein [Nemania sp. NC0429]
MAPVVDTVSDLLQKRFDCPYRQYYSDGRCVYGSNWYWYGRWIFAAVVIGLFLLIFFLWACLNSRRRRRQGHAPMYGTGWMAPNGQYYNNNPNAYNPPPPAYGAPPQYPMDTRYPNADGHYGQQSNGVEPPKNVYTGDYAPPSGPPPNK